MSSYASYGRRKPKREHEGPHICNVCQPRIVFNSRDALLKHKAEQRAKDPEKHIHCQFCGDDFISLEAEIQHLQQRHPKPQNLICPGCGLGPFIRVADLARHIERDECHKIDMAQIQEVRDEKAKFAQDLIALTNAPLKNHFTDFMPSTRKVTTNTYGWDDVHDLPAPTVVDDNKLDEDFPQLGEVKAEIAAIAGSENASSQAEARAESNTADAQSGTGENQAASAFLPPHLRRPKEDEPGAIVAESSFIVDYKQKEQDTAAASWTPPHLRRPGQSASTASTLAVVDPSQFPKPDEKPPASVPAWTTKKDLFPDAPAAQKPSQDQLKEATTLNPNYASWLDVDSPDHPEFSHGRYFCPYTESYMCPKVRCGKAFKKSGGLVSHLRGPAHSDKKYTCPWCHKEFHSLQAVTAHSESASQRCHIRYTEGYRAYMDQLTSGIVDVQAKAHEDGTHKYETTVAAMKRWGDEDKTARWVEEARKKDEAARAEEEKAKQGADRAAAFKEGLASLEAESKNKRAQDRENGSNWW